MSLDKSLGDLLASFANQIIGNVLVSLVILVIGYFAGVLYTRLRDFFSKSGPIKRVWRLNSGSGVVYLVAATIHPEPSASATAAGPSRQIPPTTGLGEFQAASYVSQSLSVGYPRKDKTIEIALSEDFEVYPPTARSGEIVSLGGPRHNATTRAYKNGRELPFDFDLGDPNFSVVEKQDGQVVNRYTPDRVGKPGTDYSIVTRLPNMHDPKKKNAVFLLEGSGTYGVTGSALVLTLSHIGAFAAYSRELKQERWQALVRVNVDGTAITPTLLKVVAF